MNEIPASEAKDQNTEAIPGSSPWPAEMCRSMIESAPWPMIVLDCDSRSVVEINEATVVFYQRSREVLLARGIEEVVPPHRRADLNRLLEQGLDSPPRDSFSEHVLPDRTLIPVEVRSFPLTWKGRPSRFFVIRDLLPRLATPGEPEVTADLDRMRRVSGSMTHDFNNLLTVILAVAEQMQVGEGDAEQQVELIAKTVRSAQELAQQRLSLGGSQTARRERLDLNAVLDGQKEVLGVVLGRQIDLETDFESGLWPVFADAAQWREVILNLAVNARDAMPKGGKFYISTRRLLLDSDEKGLGLPRGRYVHLTVRDTGFGMSEETRQRAFKPYFSTKSRSKNSGLGLASVHEVVQQCGGHIRLISAPGEGACFDIYIPAQPDETRPASPGALVLLAEDAGELRKLIQDFLTARGHEVIACGSAEVALKWAQSLTRPLDLAIVDLILPDLSGAALVQQLHARHPEARVIFMSGQLQSAQALQEQEKMAATAVFLEKPFSLHQLASTVTALLKGATGPREG